MVKERVTDGVRIAELLASELDGREDEGLGRVGIENADPDVEPSVDGTRAYDVVADGEAVATVYVHPDRSRIEFHAGREAALSAARDAGLRARAVPAPATLVFVESGADVKRAVRVVIVAVAALE